MSQQDLTGQRVEQYQVVREIGRGGMAVVYLATDVDLGRQVVLKVMQPHLSRNPDFISRFQREARAMAQLDHPHIIKVYNSGLTPDGSLYFAMQYVAGGTLTARLRQLAWEQSRLADEEALSIVRHLAGALAAAHRAGIVHRDIKPSNVLLRPDGTPILTDLGIAATQFGTRLTQAGKAIGTPHYMSPEQASGKPVDGRSDIYSLGVVLYELLAGSVPFNADSSMAILHQQIYEPHPPLQAIHRGLKPATYQLVDKCLAKAPEDRYQTAEALVQGLDAALAAERGTAAAGDERRRPLWLYGVVGLPLLLLLLLALWAFRPDERSVAATATALPAEVVVVQVTETAVSVAASPLPPTSQPLGQPTSTHVPPSSPTPTPTLAAAPVGRIVFDSIQDVPSEIYVMNPDGSGRTRLTSNAHQDDEADLSASGRFIAYESREDVEWMVMVMDIDGNNVRPLVAGRLPAWSPDDRFIAFETDGNSQTINLYELATGETRQLTSSNVLSRAASWSPTGEELAYMSRRNGVWQIFAINVDTGQERQLTVGVEDKRFPAWSPNGRLIAYNTIGEGGGPADIWLVAAEGDGEPTRVTQGGANGRAAWSPDSQTLIFNSNNDGAWVLYRINIDGTAREQLTFGGSDQRADWGN